MNKNTARIEGNNWPNTCAFQASKVSVHNNPDGCTSIPLTSPGSVWECTFRYLEVRPFSSSQGEMIFDDDEGEIATLSYCADEEVSTLLNRLNCISLPVISFSPSICCCWCCCCCSWIQLSVACSCAIRLTADSLLCKLRTTKHMPINMTDIADTVTYPLKYRGASICCQTSSGSQIWRRYAISFMAAIVMARSSLSLPQTSLAQLCM